ncbi:MAG: hypothetical protein RJA61_442 [Candidatus Parcubacteria bacterium]|jgi:hypothetical protein
MSNSNNANPILLGSMVRFNLRVLTFQTKKRFEHVFGRLGKFKKVILLRDIPENISNRMMCESARRWVFLYTKKGELRAVVENALICVSE